MFPQIYNAYCIITTKFPEHNFSQLGTEKFIADLKAYRYKVSWLVKLISKRAAILRKQVYIDC